MMPSKDCSSAMTQEERQHMKDELERKIRSGTSAPKAPGQG